MSLPYLPVYSLTRECRERLMTDPEYARQAFERLLGPPNPMQKMGRAWTQFNCPCEMCAGKGDYKLGIDLQGASWGGFKCLRCDFKGKGFVSMCRQLYRDPGEFVDGDSNYVAPPPRKKIVEVREHPLADKEFGRFWKWVAAQAEKAYGATRLTPEHQANLTRRGLELDKLPLYFSMPPADVLDLALRRHGEALCDKAGIWDSEKQKRRMFFQPRRMALVYPNVDWLDRTVPFGYLRSYNPTCRTDNEKKYKLIGAPGYQSNRNCYVRVDMSRPQPLLIGEGEIKIEAAWQARTNGLGRPGINSGHEEIARIVVKMLELSEGTNPTRIVLCDDTEADDYHQQFVELHIHRLAAVIRRIVSEQYHGYQIPIHRVELPAIPGRKTDLDDYIGGLVANHGVEQGRALWWAWLKQAVIQAGPFQIKERDDTGGTGEEGPQYRQAQGGDGGRGSVAPDYRPANRRTRTVT